MDFLVIKVILHKVILNEQAIINNTVLALFFQVGYITCYEKLNIRNYFNQKIDKGTFIRRIEF